MSSCNQLCPVYHSNALERRDGEAKACLYDGSSEGYAATEPMLSGLILPSVQETSAMYSGNGRNDVCKHGVDSVGATVEVVSYSLKNTDVFVHITDPLGPSPELLMSNTHVHSGPQLVVCVLVDNESGSGEKLTVTTSMDSTPLVSNVYVVSEIMSSLSASFRTTVWQWTSATNPNCRVLSTGKSNTFIQTCGPLGFGDVGMYPPMKRGDSVDTSVLPMFYTDRSTPTVVVMYKAIPDRFSCVDLGVDFQARSRLVTDRVYDTSCPTGRCFCCQYLVNLRSRARGVTSTKPAARSLKLSPMFVQNRSI